MSIIRIKRSGATGSPAALAQGELAYSFLSGSQSNGGDRLYIGTGTETGGIAANIEVIGGKYFTSMLDHAPGALTATSALIVDANSKVDNFNVDNLNINDNSITATNINGSIILAPNGSGAVNVSGKIITNAADPVANTDVVTLQYLTSVISGTGGVLNISGDTGTDAVTLSTDVLAFVGGSGLTSTVTGNTVSYAVDSVTLGTQTTGDYVATIGVTAGTGLSVSGSGEGAAVTIAGLNATTSTKGVASFNSTNFTVTSGVVTSNALTIGSSAVNLGGTISTVAGLTSVTSGNLQVATNEISATNVNGNVSLKPDGTGTVAVNNKRISGLADPIDAMDAVTKQYADNIATGLHVKEGVDAATTTALAIHSGGTVTYDNGVDGVGATLTLSVGITVLDGKSLTAGDRVLIKDEANAVHNGIYVYTSSTVFTRDELFDSDQDVEGGDFVFVVEGTVNGGTGWVQSNTVNIIGTDSITFLQFSGPGIGGTYTAGAGLTLTDDVFSVNVDSSSIEISADTLRVKALGITNAMLAGSIDNTKLTNSTISGVALGSDLNTLTFNSGLVAGSYNGSAPVTISVDSASSNTASKIVIRDASGNFAAGTITAALSGNATTATTLQTARTISLGGSLSGSASFDGSANITITGSVIDATTITKGIASFNSANFTVTSGAVSLSAIDGGTY